MLKIVADSITREFISAHTFLKNCAENDSTGRAYQLGRVDGITQTYANFVQIPFAMAKERLEKMAFNLEASKAD